MWADILNKLDLPEKPALADPDEDDEVCDPRGWGCLPRAGVDRRSG
jgi:hypothetical protein